MHYLDEIYHSGYLDGYYAGMELYHADDSEMTDEEKEKARRKRRRRNIALGVGGAAALGVGGYAVGRALRKRGRGIVPAGGPRLIGGPTGGSSGSAGSSGSRPRGPRPTGPTGPKRIGGPKLERVKTSWFDVEEPIGWDFKKNKPKYAGDEIRDISYRAHAANKYFTEYDHDKKKWVRRDSTSYRH